MARNVEREKTRRERPGRTARKKDVQLASFPELNPNPVMEIDWDGRVIYLNPAARKLFPDLEHLGARHPFLAGLGSVTAFFREGKEEFHARDIRVGPVWYHQTFYPPPEPGRLRVYAYDNTQGKGLEEDLRRSRDRFALLSETAGRLLQSDRPQEVVEELCRKVMAHLDCQVFFNFLVEEGEERLRLNAYAGISAGEARRIEWLNFGVAVCGCVARDGVRIVAENIPGTRDPRTDLVHSYGIQAYACHPLLSRGEVFGTLSFGTRSRGSFSDDELSLMKTVADQVSLAMERVRLYEKANLRAEELDRRVGERTRDLAMRLEEMNCLCAVSGLLNREEALPAEDLQRVVEAIPPGWQYPEITCARVRADGMECKTGNFRETPWMQAGAIRSRGLEAGTLEVGYLEERPARDEGPFLKEERILLNALADQVGEYLEREKARLSLRESNDLLEGAFSSIDLLIAYMDRDFNFLRVNRAYAEADGRTPEFYPGRNHFALFPDPENEAIFRRVVETGKPFFTLEKPFTYAEHPERGVTYWDWSLHPVKGPEGRVNGIVLSLVNVSERRKAQEALRHNEELLRNLLELLPLGVWVADRQGVITYGNPAGRRIWAGHRYVGIDRFGEYRGWWLNSGKKIEPGEWAVARAVRKGETSLNEEIEIECFDGSRKIILNSAIPLRSPGGEITGALVINHDVTESRQAEQRIRQVQKMEALGTLAGGIAHDFNNILMPIAINAEMALLDLKGGVIPPPHCLRLIQQAANRGRELVKQIITYSRQKEQPRSPVDILPVIKEALKFLRATIPASIRIRTSIGLESAVASADPTQIHQVLMNLCNNAAYALREKGGVLEVGLARMEVTAESSGLYGDLKPGSFLRLTVRDNGEGMPREVREKAFDPFFTTKRPGEGTGMGLAVVQGIVKAHEGAVFLESEPGKGTAVQVFLPAAQPGVAGDSLPSPPATGGRERILVIDDEEIQVRSLRHMLERLGYRITGTTDPREALEVFRRDPLDFDLVITDQAMPHLTGSQLVKELLRLRPDLPIILFTGYSETLDEEGARSLGVRDFGMKPMSLQDLAGRIRKALKK